LLYVKTPANNDHLNFYLKVKFIILVFILSKLKILSILTI